MPQLAPVRIERDLNGLHPQINAHLHSKEGVSPALVDAPLIEGLVKELETIVCDGTNMGGVVQKVIMPWVGNGNTDLGIVAADLLIQVFFYPINIS